MLHEEVAKYRKLSGDTNPTTPISRIGGYLDGYEKALEQTHWIPVSERLPKNDEDVLVCFPQGGMAVAYYHIDCTYYPTQFEDMNETGWFNEEAGAFYFEPIAWMPLPEPYKVESQESEG